jgi:hypothetical protein
MAEKKSASPSNGIRPRELESAHNSYFLATQSCSSYPQFNSDSYNIRTIRFLSKMSFRLIFLLSRESNENAQISGRSIFYLNRIAARRTIAEQEENNEIKLRLRAATSSISKNIGNLPRIIVNRK